MLINDFAELGFKGLIPKTFDSITGDHLQFDEDLLNEPDFEDMIDMDEKYLDYKDPELDARFDTLEELKDYLGYTFTPSNEFINFSIANIFNTTKTQLKLIDFNLLYRGSINLFIDILNDESIIKEIPSIEQRIKYATVCSIINIHNFPLPVTGFTIEPINRLANELKFDLCFTSKDRDNLVEYLKRLIFSHSEENSLDLMNLLYDYYAMYRYGILRNLEREQNGENLVIYELFPKFSHIKEMHDKAMRDMNYLNSKFKRPTEQIDADIKKVTNLNSYKQFLYSSDKYSIIAPKGYNDLKNEGIVLNHCVLDYADRFANAETFIYFLRKNFNISEPYFTIEVKQSEYGHRFTITQCYTENDETYKSHDCKEFIREWAKEKKLKIVCYI